MRPVQRQYTWSDELHNEARLLKLNDRRYAHVLLYMFQLAQISRFQILEDIAVYWDKN